LQGARSVGKSTVLGLVAEQRGVEVIDLGDPVLQAIPMQSLRYVQRGLSDRRE
jgi:dephospho-CoA kinase